MNNEEAEEQGCPERSLNYRSDVNNNQLCQVQLTAVNFRPIARTLVQGIDCSFTY